jgi:organic radical activating enzyme
MNKDYIDNVIMMTNTEISPTFCYAKWYHTTIYLQLGDTHSCYHPQPHKIPLEELENNPSALHNTEEKKQERREMLAGERPSGCQYCWNIEDMGPEYLSDRHMKTASIHRPHHFEEVKKKDPTINVKPSYIEISFGNECNFKCGYCHPKYSSRYYQEIKKHGPVETVKNHRCDIDWFEIHEKEDTNPYVKAWWDWWPELRESLQILRITGGEPIMHKSTWELLDDLDANPLPNLELNLNSNLGMKHDMVRKFSEKINKLVEEKKILRFRMFTSIDTWNERAEYIRTGLDIELWEKNLDHYLMTVQLPVAFMITFNILAVTTFKSLLEKILEWRGKYNHLIEPHRQILGIDMPYLKEPLQYDINILPKEEFMPYMEESLQFIKDNIEDGNCNKFSTIEYEKFHRVVDYMKNTHYDEDKLKEGRKDFYNFFTAMDERRGTDFYETFPEMFDFMDRCANEE